MAEGSQQAHNYQAHLTWDGNKGTGTSSYAVYGREYTITVGGKPTFAGSADHTFRGKRELHNPEDLLVMSLFACHMLAYLALCALQGVRVTAYEDSASGTMMSNRNGGRFTEVILRPHVTVAVGSDITLATNLHETAHEQCFIASSCNFPVLHQPTIVEE
jgi:organic hydroperoxide reductase OsmC/OhrA